MIITLLIAIVIGISLASYLALISHQNRSVMRSLAWNSAMPVLESGIEEALTQLHFNGITNLSANSWSLVAGGDYYKKRVFSDGSYYEVTITPSDPPVINSVGYQVAPLPITTVFGVIFGAITPFAGQANNQLLKRKVRVSTRNSALFTKAMLAKGQINLNGNNIATDSFDSLIPAYNTLGKYDPAKKKANGDVATISGLVNSLSIGNANIMGHVSTGPKGSMTIGANGTVGDVSWVSGGSKGIETGYSANDLNVQIDDAQLPGLTWTSASSGTYLVGTTNFNFVFSGNSNYKVDNFSGKVYVAPGANVTVYVPAGGSMSFTGEGGIVLGLGAKLTLYVGATSATIGGNGVLNTGSALNFLYYGLPSNTSLSFSGNGTFAGAIYAPEAAFTLNGGGNNTLDFVGASVTSSVTMNGHFNFHYDEALARIGPGDGYVVTSWNEVSPN